MKKKLLSLTLILLNTFIFSISTNITAMENKNDNCNNFNGSSTQKVPSETSDEMIEGIINTFKSYIYESKKVSLDRDIASSNKKPDGSEIKLIEDLINEITNYLTDFEKNKDKQITKTNNDTTDPIKKIENESEKICNIK